jgi:hypothetical protein
VYLAQENDRGAGDCLSLKGILFQPPQLHEIPWPHTSPVKLEEFVWKIHFSELPFS